MDQEERLYKLAARQTAREGIKLSAVAHLPEKLFGPVCWYAKHSYVAPRWPQQARHQVHQCRLAGTIRPHQTGYAGPDAEFDTVHSENLSIEFGDVVEDYRG